jgi:hypothetical protein
VAREPTKQPFRQIAVMDSISLDGDTIEAQDGLGEI